MAEPKPIYHADGYPTDVGLERLQHYDLIHEPLSGLIDLIKEMWTYYQDEWQQRHKPYFFLATGGWSGNEDIIGALEQNFLFWSLYWHRSERGGAFWFDLGNSVKLGHGPVATASHERKDGE